MRTQAQRRPFGRTGLMVSPLGFGAAPIGFLKTEQEQIGQLLNALLDAGMNLIDTAATYLGSEEAIGRAVGHRRADYVLVSKCGHSSEDVPGKSWSAPVITATVDRALRRLRTDHLDVMLLHSCDLETLKKGEAIGALVKAREAGKIRFAGYSGDNAAAAYATGLKEVAVLETSVNIVDQANIDAVLPAARDRGTAVIAKRPIANVAWRPLDQQPGMYRDYAKPYHERFIAMGLRLEDLGLEAGVTDWAEVALRFTLSQPGVHCAIIGTTNPENARRNMEAACKPPLPAHALARIREAFTQAQRRAGQAWPSLE